MLDLLVEEGFASDLLAAEGAVELGVGVEDRDGGQRQVNGQVVLEVERVDEAPEGNGLAGAGLAREEHDPARLLDHLQARGELVEPGPGVEIARGDRLVEGAAAESKAGFDHSSACSSCRRLRSSE